MPLFIVSARKFCANQPRLWWLAAVLGIFVGVAVGRNLSTSVSIVDGVSMAPTFQPGAHVLTEPITGPLSRGDVVLIDDGHHEYALKRVVGLPGERVQLWRGFVFINGRLLSEPYLPRSTYTFADDRDGRTHFGLAGNEYFVLGDNRQRSLDSRTYGPVLVENIKSRVPLPENEPRPGLVNWKLPTRESAPATGWNQRPFTPGENPQTQPGMPRDPHG